MPNDPLYVTFTMDCEAVARESPEGGPRTWALGERAMRGFAETLNNEDLRGAYFAVPRTAKRLGNVLLDVEKSGIELGLHCHPQNAGYRDYLAGYELDRQKEILELARTEWADAMGRSPVTFRPGNFSANDDTFIALVELGFRQGSCSLPGRKHWGVKADWEGGYAFAHHADPLDRLVEGTLEFYEVPVTAKFEESAIDGNLYYTPDHLRIERAGIREFAEGVIQEHVSQMRKERVAVKTIVVMTHNTQEYSKPDAEASVTLKQMIDVIRSVSEKEELTLTPATIEEIHAHADRAMAQ